MLKKIYKYTTPFLLATKKQIFFNKVLAFLTNLFYPIYCKFNKQNQVTPPFNKKTVIISLTTYSSRINIVYYCIKSLLNQSEKDFLIVLWLDEEEFNLMNIPKKIKNLQSEVFKINFCKNYRSYKKILPSIDEFKSHIIVTCDDDTLYSEDWLKNLLNTSYKFPNTIVCYRAHEITFDDEKIKPYLEWNGLSKDIKGPSLKLVAIGVGGILYPPNIFNSLKYSYEEISLLCPTNDDIWLKYYELLNLIPVVKVFENSKEFFSIRNSQKIGLTNLNNCKKNRNDLAISNLENFYCRSIFELINERSITDISSK